MTLSTTLSDTLARGVDALGLSLSDDQQRQLLAYVDLLVKWNQAYNLTAIRDPAEMVTRHLLDSLAVLPYVEETDTLELPIEGAPTAGQFRIATPWLT